MTIVQSKPMSAARRAELVGAVCALVADAEQRQTPARRVDQVVARWSREVPSPEDVLTLVADARAELAPSELGAAILAQVERRGVAAVAQRQVREALTDALTGLATRARLEDEVQHLIAVAVRTRTPLTAVMIDVDHLKQINDEQGHLAGDAAIAAVGCAIREHVRKTDRAFRWGGDEFALFLPGTTAEEARLVVDRIRRSCSTALSAGIAAHSGFALDTDVATWIGRADEDLYRRRGAARTPTTRRPRLGRARRLTTGSMGVAVLMATATGWLGATAVAHREGVGPATAAQSRPAVVAPAGGGVQARPADRPTVSRETPARTRPQHSTPAVVITVSAPSAVRAAVPAVPGDVDTPAPVPAPAVVTGTEEVEPQVGLVGGLLGSVGGLLDALL